jgi:hypothetical protein
MYLVCAALALWLLPFDSDGAFAVQDAIWGALDLERLGPGSISPHHPLVHLLLLLVTAIGDHFRVEHAAHFGCRLIAGAGGVILLRELFIIGGSARAWLSFALAGIVFVSRGFLVEMATGESVVPAAALGLMALRLASSPDSKNMAIVLAVTAALAMRQDNIFIVPGVVLGVLDRPGVFRERVRGAAKVLCLAFVTTLALYGFAWFAATRGNQSFGPWLLGIGRLGSWTGSESFGWGRLAVYLASIPTALFGTIGSAAFDSAASGLAWVAVMCVIAACSRGAEPRRSLVGAVAVTLVGRAVFHTWFEAENFEWLVMPVALTVAAVAAIAHGRPRTSPLAQRFGIALSVALVVIIAALHGRWTIELRQRRLITAVADVVAGDGGPFRVIAHGGRAHLALELLAVPHVAAADDLGVLVEQLGSEMRASRVPLLVVTDRFALDGMPATVRRYPSAMMVDGMVSSESMKFVRRDGLIYALKYTPTEEGVSSAPETRWLSDRSGHFR